MSAAVRRVLDWHEREAVRVNDWANPEGRLTSIATRAFNQIDALVQSSHDSTTTGEQ